MENILKINGKNLFCMLSNPMMNCGTNFLHTLYMYKIMKKKCIKSDLKEISFKLVTND